MRLIDADALMRKTVELFYTTPYFNHISEMIERAPTIERPHGEWIVDKKICGADMRKEGE